MAEGKFVAYYRVSTDRQGKSGLGLDAQRKAVSDYLNGGAWELVAEFTEVESGKRADRPQLDAALVLAKKLKATLIIAKLDRLSRDVHFISGLMKGAVDFVVCDFPQANKLTVHILAAVAEHEREMISQRTKAALAAAKARGTILGSHGKVQAAANKADANAAAEALRGTIDTIRAEGFKTVAAITDELNRRAVPTARGGRWHVASTFNLLKRLTA